MEPRNIPLLQNKIAELRTALFFCENQEALPFAAYLVEDIRMDGQGDVWLHVNKPGEKQYHCDHSFPVSLEFYRKGVPYTIDITGTASIEKHSDDSRLLLKVIIGKLVYNEFAVAETLQPLETIGKILRNIFDIPVPLDTYTTENA